MGGGGGGGGHDPTKYGYLTVIVVHSTVHIMHQNHCQLSIIADKLHIDYTLISTLRGIVLRLHNVSNFILRSYYVHIVYVQINDNRSLSHYTNPNIEI